MGEGARAEAKPSEAGEGSRGALFGRVVAPVEHPMEREYAGDGQADHQEGPRHGEDSKASH